ncbi:MAG: peptidase U32 family protein, partial [bacterium]
ENCPNLPLHISTQANTTNSVSAKFWHSLGAARIVAARELGFAELRQIREALPEELSLEAFVHGAMCISYSGRCLLSNYLVGRDANRGLCTHPCRWKYAVFQENTEGSRSDLEANEAVKRTESSHLPCAEGETKAVKTGESGKCPAEKTEGGHLPCAESGYAVQEATRPGEYFPIEENERGTFLFNSKDLCMIGHLPELYSAGIDSFKIEGRMKTALYVAACARTYRMAMDDYEKDPELYKSRIPWYMQQIAACTTRTFTTGFYFGKPGADEQIYESSTYVTGSTYLGLVEEARDDGRVCLHQKNKFCVGDMIEIMKPDGRNVPARVLSIRNGASVEMPSAPHAGEELSVLLEGEAAAAPWDILRTPAEALRSCP